MSSSVGGNLGRRPTRITIPPETPLPPRLPSGGGLPLVWVFVLLAAAGLGAGGAALVVKAGDDGRRVSEATTTESPVPATSEAGDTETLTTTEETGTTDTQYNDGYEERYDSAGDLLCSDNPDVTSPSCDSLDSEGYVTTETTTDYEGNEEQIDEDGNTVCSDAINNYPSC